MDPRDNQTDKDESKVAEVLKPGGVIPRKRKLVKTMIIHTISESVSSLFRRRHTADSTPSVRPPQIGSEKLHMGKVVPQQNSP